MSSDLADRVEGLERHEIEVIEMIEGVRPAEWGAWVAVALESLRDRRLITEYVGAKPRLTDAGRAALLRAKEADHG